MLQRCPNQTAQTAAGEGTTYRTITDSNTTAGTAENDNAAAANNNKSDDDNNNNTYDLALSTNVYSPIHTHIHTSKL